MADVKGGGKEVTKDELLTVIINSLPHAEQVSNLDTVSEPDAIRLTWRQDTFRVSLGGGVEKVVNGLLKSDDTTMLMEALIKQAAQSTG